MRKAWVVIGGLAAGCAAPAGGDETGTTGVASATTDAATTGAPTTGEPTTGGPTWATWTKFPERVFRGQVFDGAWIAADPCVLRDGETWRMFYTCVAGASVGGLCQVTSPDGIAWTPGPSIDPLIEGLIVRGRPGEGWDENMETCSVIREDGGLRLFYSGYPNDDAEGQRAPAALGSLRSSDATSFVRDPDAPLLTATPGGRDGDDIFSAVVLTEGATLAAVYVGWCVDGYHDGLDCVEGPSVQILGAERDAGGVWTKRAEPVLTPRADVAWMQHGVAEPDLIRGPDGRYYLFFTGGLGAEEPHVTGLAVGPTAFGPWEMSPAPVLSGGAAGEFDACGAFAPSVVIEGDTVRMWYLGLDDCDETCPSCDYAACGCEGRFSIGYAEASWPLHTP